MQQQLCSARQNLLDSEVFVLSNCCDVDVSADPWRFLMACLPQSLLTCLQVLLLDAPALVEYKIAAAGEPLILPPPQAPRSARATGESQQGSIRRPTHVQAQTLTTTRRQTAVMMTTATMPQHGWR